ncbi:hypothetical protein ACLK18_19665 [Escherichia coli]
MTIFISTHFMNEAERCDRISLMHAGKVLASGTPQELVEKRGAASWESHLSPICRKRQGRSNESRSAARGTRHHPRAASGI